MFTFWYHVDDAGGDCHDDHGHDDPDDHDQDDDSDLLLLRHRLCRGDRLQSESPSSRVGDAIRDLDKIIVMWNSDDYDHLNTSE